MVLLSQLSPPEQPKASPRQIIVTVLVLPIAALAILWLASHVMTYYMNHPTWGRSSQVVALIQDPMMEAEISGAGLLRQDIQPQKETPFTVLTKPRPPSVRNWYRMEYADPDDDRLSKFIDVALSHGWRGDNRDSTREDGCWWGVNDAQMSLVICVQSQDWLQYYSGEPAPTGTNVYAGIAYM